jgi:hypothetical protein
MLVGQRLDAREVLLVDGREELGRVRIVGGARPSVDVPDRAVRDKALEQPHCHS